MIELTAEQQHQLDATNGKPRIVADRIPQVASLPAADSDIPVGIREARAAFRRDLPRLLADGRTRGKYVCYHRSGLVVVSNDYRGIIDECNRREFPENEYLVEKVVPGERPDEEVIDGILMEFIEEPA